MIIDTHHHFWHYNSVEFGWIDNEMAAIRKSFLLEDLASTIQNSCVDGVVTVQARQCLEETEWLLQLASENEFIKGVVGWLPLGDKNIQAILDQYRGNRWLKGVRHVVQGESDPEFILGEAFNQGVSQLKEYGLVYDILILEHQLANTIRFVDRHPDQQFVVDHIAKPKIKTNEIQPWQNLLKELARRENVSCKISGMVTEADYQHWTEAQLQPYFDVVLDAFGPTRLMFGSDWPVCLVATNYSEWLQLVKKQVSTLSCEEQNQIFYHNALTVYQL